MFALWKTPLRKWKGKPQTGKSICYIYMSEKGFIFRILKKIPMTQKWQIIRFEQKSLKNRCINSQ